MQQKVHSPETTEDKELTVHNTGRRNFLTKLSGVAALSAVVVACTKSNDFSENKNGSNGANSLNASDSKAISMGVGDYAVLNYAFLLEQLEAQFYMMVTQHYYSGISDQAKLRFAQIRDHEIAHREFFKTALGKYAIPDLEFDFSSINFSSRGSVLGSAKSFEDLGVSAYNGAAKYIVNADYLLAAGKIVSVEARHAAYIRDLLQPISFANNTVIDSMGLDLANPPLVVAKAVAPYLKIPINLESLPH